MRVQMFYWTDGALPSIPDNFAAGVAYWYNEIKLYKYAAPGTSGCRVRVWACTICSERGIAE